MIIGLSGYAGVGKDTAADALKELGFERVAFADKLKDVLLAIDPVVGMYGRQLVRLSAVYEIAGSWDAVKSGAFGTEIRSLLQRLGTEGGRNLLGENVWVDAALRGLDFNDSKYVVTDVRFPNELETIRKVGGQVWRINRPGTGPSLGHASETSLDNAEFDGTIENDGTLDEFRAKVIDLLGNEPDLTKYPDEPEAPRPVDKVQSKKHWWQ